MSLSGDDGREVPTDVTDRGRQWLGATGRADQLAVYCDRYEVVPPQETTVTDRPPAADRAVRKYDEKAVEESVLAGKWIVKRSEDMVDACWQAVCEMVAGGRVWRAKVPTKWRQESREEDAYVVLVYTPNYFCVDDVWRVRQVLRECGVTEEIPYKPDIYTMEEVYPDTVAEHGLPSVARYRA